MIQETELEHPSLSQKLKSITLNDAIWVLTVDFANLAAFALNFSGVSSFLES